MTAKRKAKRYPVLISPLWRLMLRPFGATPERCFVEVGDEVLHVSFGRAFDGTFPLDTVEGASLAHWPLWAGVGPRYFRGTVGLIGTYVNIVEIRFTEPQRVRMLLSVNCTRMYLSVEQPGELIEALTRRPAVAAKAA